MHFSGFYASQLMEEELYIMQERDGRIDILRFVFAVLIMVFHAHRVGYSEHPFPQGYAFVEFYFFLSGYYLAHHAVFYPNDTAIAYTQRKFLRIIPYTSLCVLFAYFLAGIRLLRNGNLSLSSVFHLVSSLPFELLLVPASGLHGTVQITSLWYLSSLLIVLPTVAYVVMKHRDGVGRVAAFTAPIVAYGYLYIQYGDVVVNWDSWEGVLAMLIRAGAGLFAGCEMYFVCMDIRKRNISAPIQTVMYLASIVCFVIAVILGCFLKRQGLSVFLIFLFIWFALLLLLSTTVRQTVFVRKCLRIWVDYPYRCMSATWLQQMLFWISAAAGVCG